MTTISSARPTALNEFEVVEATTADDLAAVFDLRRLVFRDEQGIVSGSVEDADDRRSLLVLARLRQANGAARPVGTGRITFDAGPGGEAIITWVATRPELRGRGVGTAVMRHLLAAADRRGVPAVILAAQEPAVEFYRRLGFAPDGKRYLVTGVYHLPMRRQVPPAVQAPSPPPLDW